MNIIVIILSILFVLIITIVIFYISKKNVNKTGVSWIFKRPSIECSNQPLKEPNNNKIPYNGIPPSKTMLRMSMKPNSSLFKKYRALGMALSIPDKFSWRDKGGDMIEKARNQGNCGGCWAFSIVSVLGDRFAIKNNIKSPHPSVVYLLSQCSITDDVCADIQGCDGGNILNGIVWLQNPYNGNKIESCWPYSVVQNSLSYGAQSNNVAPNSLQDPSLSNCCYNCCYPADNTVNSSTPLLSIKLGSIQYFGETIDKIQSYTEENINKIISDIQIEILQNGPVTSCFVVLKTFLDYYTKDSLSVYSNNDVIIDIDACEFNDCSNTGYTNEGHAIAITGWGIQNGVRYWEVRNSWCEESNNDNGYCKIAFTTFDKIKYSFGIDIPIISVTSDNYYGGVVSFTPNNIDNLDELIKNGIFEKSTILKV